MAERPRAPLPRAALPTLAIVVCVGLQVVVASSAAGASVRVGALLALAVTAVALCLRQALGGLLGARALRAALIGPIVFSIVLTVVLALDAGARAGDVLR